MTVVRAALVLLCALALAACSVTPPSQRPLYPGYDNGAGCRSSARSASGPRVTARPSLPDLSSTTGSPIVITVGGVYQGTWTSDDPDVPAVEINTPEPVVIENSRIRSRGEGIRSSVDGVRLTVRNTLAQGTNPGRAGTTPGRFVSVTNPARIEINNNAIDGTSGIKIDGFIGSRGWDSITVRGNTATDIDGRRSTGDGYSTDDRSAEYVQFLQLAMVHDVPGIDIGWNYVFQTPAQSRVEDVISLYLSSGTRASPISVHDNYVDGAYPSSPATDTLFSGGGIMLGDGGDDAADTVDWVTATENTVVNTSNYGMAVSSGHNIVARDNRILSPGVLPDGVRIPTQNVGFYALNLYDRSAFGPVTLTGNSVGWARPALGDRNDYSVVPGATVVADQPYAGPITLGTVAAEYEGWSRRVAAADVVVGPLC